MRSERKVKLGQQSKIHALDSLKGGPHHNRLNNRNGKPCSWTRAMQLLVYKWCMALIPWCTTPIAYIIRLIAKKKGTHNTTDKREIERRVLERYSIEKAIGREGLIARREESQETD
jgi:hypothetical protein